MYRFLIFLFITQFTFSKILFCTYENDYLIFNNKIIRETISSKDITSYFAVNIPNVEYIETDETSYCSFIDDYPLTKYKFKDQIIKNNTISLGKYNYTTDIEHIFNIVGIFKSSPLHNTQPSLFINLHYDDNIIFSNELHYKFNTVSFYEQFISTYGFHTFEITIESKGIWCLCPSKGNGFENNKYFFAWINTSPIFESYSQLLKIKNNEYSIII
jgi:hypothetical protein